MKRRLSVLLRALCPHRWQRTGSELECFGMGLTRFEQYQCRWCGDEASAYRDGSLWQNRGTFIQMKKVEE